MLAQQWRKWLAVFIIHSRSLKFKFTQPACGLLWCALLIVCELSRLEVIQLRRVLNSAPPIVSPALPAATDLRPHAAVCRTVFGASSLPLWAQGGAARQAAGPAGARLASCHKLRSHRPGGLGKQTGLIEWAR